MIWPFSEREPDIDQPPKTVRDELAPARAAMREKMRQLQKALEEKCAEESKT